jgi:hypothetical protein
LVVSFSSARKTRSAAKSTRGFVKTRTAAQAARSNIQDGNSWTTSIE